MGGMDLSLGISLTSGGNAPAANPLCDAIAKKVCVTASEGNKPVTLAPHVVYVRGKEHWVAGLEAGKFGSWRVSKLSAIVLTDIPFTPDAGFDPNDPQFGNEIICRIGVE